MTVRLIAAAAAVVLLAMPGVAGAAVFSFPSQSSTVISDGAAPAGEFGDFWSVARGDRVSQTYTATGNVDRAILRLRTPYNTLGEPVTWALEIAGRQVKRFAVFDGVIEQPPVDVSFATITGPTYDVTLRLVSETPNGAHSFAPGSLELLDTIAPDTRISLAGRAFAFVSPAAATLSFSSFASDVARYECSLDGSPFALCSSPATWPSLPVGTHTFRVRAIDDAGNVDATPAEQTFQVLPSTACPGGAATVQAGKVTVLSLGCLAGDRQPQTLIDRWPDLGTLGVIDQAAQTVPYTAPAVAGLTRFTYHGRWGGHATFNLTISGPIGSRVSSQWNVARDHTKARRLSVTDVPAWAVVSVRCHKRCSYRHSWPAAASGHKAINLLGGLSHLRLRPGAVIDVRVAAPYATPKVVRYTIRAHRQPLRTLVRASPPKK